MIVSYRKHWHTPDHINTRWTLSHTIASVQLKTLLTMWPRHVSGLHTSFTCSNTNLMSDCRQTRQSRRHVTTTESFSVTQRPVRRNMSNMRTIELITAVHGTMTSRVTNPERSSDGKLTSPLQNTSRTCTHQVFISCHPHTHHMLREKHQ